MSNSPAAVGGPQKLAVGARLATDFWLVAGTLVVAAGLLAGCSGGPQRVAASGIDPSDAAQKAIRQYDQDGDGSLSDAELQACPGILLNKSVYDSDQNGAISAQEIEARLAELTSAHIGQMPLQLLVLWNGRPLAGADVKMVPEEYLGSEVKAAAGRTGESGVTVMDIPDEELPQSERGLRGVHVGTFRVEVTHPTVPIPQKYNSHTTLGYESQLGSSAFTLELKK